jgi:hypothetical protein
MPFMCIIQNMLWYYIKHITNVDPLKPKVIKLTYTRKVTFNINGTIIHFALTIPLNKNLTQLNTSSDEKYCTFTKTYDFYFFSCYRGNIFSQKI